MVEWSIFLDIRSKNKRKHVIRSSSSTLELGKLWAIKNEVLIFCVTRGVIIHTITLTSMLATEATSHSCIVSMTMVLLPLVSFSQAITAFPVLWRWIKGVGVNFFSNFLPSTDLVSCGQTAFSVYAGVVNSA